MTGWQQLQSITPSKGFCIIKKNQECPLKGNSMLLFKTWTCTTFLTYDGSQHL